MPVPPYIDWGTYPLSNVIGIVGSSGQVYNYSAVGHGGETVTGYSFQWYRTTSSLATGAGAGGGSAISGATGTTYTVQCADRGYYIYCLVTAHGSMGDDIIAHSNTTGSTANENVPSNTSAPSVSPSGTQVIGTGLSCSTGSWSSSCGITAYSYAWYSNGSYVGGGSTYTIKLSDYTHSIVCYVTASDSAGYTTAASNTIVAHSATPVNTALPTVSGTKQVGSALTTTNGSWEATYAPSPTSYTYQWQRDAQGNGVYSDISGASSSSYTLVDADDQCNLRCNVTGVHTGGNTTATTASYGVVLEPAPTNSVVPSLSGTNSVPNTLTVANGTWAHMGGYNPTYAYQWYRDTQGDGVYNTIGGAVGTTFVLSDADAGCNHQCIVTATNSGGTLSKTATTLGQTTQAIANTLEPSITGGAFETGTLYGNKGTWVGFPAPSFAYQWQYSTDGGSTWNDIAGATGVTLDLTSATIGTAPDHNFLDCEIRFEVTAS